LQSLARDPLKQKLKFGTINPVALHDETDQGIVYQISERTLGDVHDISPRLFREPAKPGDSEAGQQTEAIVCGAANVPGPLDHGVAYPLTVPPVDVN
jgi:hypothetical protein